MSFWNIKKAPIQEIIYGYAVHHRYNYCSIKMNFDDKTVDYELITGPGMTNHHIVPLKDVVSFLCGWDDADVSDDRNYAIAITTREIGVHPPKPWTDEARNLTPDDPDGILSLRDEHYGSGVNWMTRMRITHPMNVNNSGYASIALRLNGRSDIIKNQIKNSYFMPERSEDESANKDEFDEFIPEDASKSESDAAFMETYREFSGEMYDE